MEIKHCGNPKVRELAIMKCVHKKGGCNNKGKELIVTAALESIHAFLRAASSIIKKRIRLLKMSVGHTVISKCPRPFAGIRFISLTSKKEKKFALIFSRVCDFVQRTS